MSTNLSSFTSPSGLSFDAQSYLQSFGQDEHSDPILSNGSQGTYGYSPRYRVPAIESNSSSYFQQSQTQSFPDSLFSPSLRQESQDAHSLLHSSPSPNVGERGLVDPLSLYGNSLIEKSSTEEKYFVERSPAWSYQQHVPRNLLTNVHRDNTSQYSSDPRISQSPDTDHAKILEGNLSALASIAACFSPGFLSPNLDPVKGVPKEEDKKQAWKRDEDQGHRTRQRTLGMPTVPKYSELDDSLGLSPQQTKKRRRKILEDDSQRFPYKLMRLVENPQCDYVRWINNEEIEVINPEELARSLGPIKVTSLFTDLRKHGWQRNLFGVAKDYYLYSNPSLHRYNYDEDTLTKVKRNARTESQVERKVGDICRRLAGGRLPNDITPKHKTELMKALWEGFCEEERREILIQ